MSSVMDPDALDPNSIYWKNKCHTLQDELDETCEHLKELQDAVGELEGTVVERVESLEEEVALVIEVAETWKERYTASNLVIQKLKEEVATLRAAFQTAETSSGVVDRDGQESFSGESIATSQSSQQSDSSVATSTTTAPSETFSTAEVHPSPIRPQPLLLYNGVIIKRVPRAESEEMGDPAASRLAAARKKIKAVRSTLVAGVSTVKSFGSSYQSTVLDVLSVKQPSTSTKENAAPVTRLPSTSKRLSIVRSNPRPLSTGTVQCSDHGSSIHSRNRKLYVVNPDLSSSP